MSIKLTPANKIFKWSEQLFAAAETALEPGDVIKAIVDADALPSNVAVYISRRVIIYHAMVSIGELQEADPLLTRVGVS